MLKITILTLNDEPKVILEFPLDGDFDAVGRADTVWHVMDSLYGSTSPRVIMAQTETSGINTMPAENVHGPKQIVELMAVVL